MHLDIIYIKVHSKIYAPRKKPKQLINWDGGSMRVLHTGITMFMKCLPLSFYPKKSRKRKLPSNIYTVLLLPRNISTYMCVAAVYITSGQIKLYMMKIAVFWMKDQGRKTFYFCWGCVLATCRLRKKLNLYERWIIHSMGDRYICLNYSYCNATQKIKGFTCRAWGRGVR